MDDARIQQILHQTERRAENDVEPGIRGMFLYKAALMGSVLSHELESSNEMVLQKASEYALQTSLEELHLLFKALHTAINGAEARQGEEDGVHHAGAVAEPRA